jgi:predicted O-linked N-acetylglucosamine transferase (SPINDLY family)
MSWLKKVLSGKSSREQQPSVQPPAPAIQTPLDAATAMREGNEHVAAGNLERALVCFRQALALDPQSIPARINLAFALQGSGQPEPAVPLLREVVAMAPDNADAHFMLGSEYLRQRRSPEAKQHLERAVALQPALVWAYLPLCQVLFELGDLAQSLLVVKRGLEFAPDLAELHHYRGNVHFAQGEFELAGKSYAEAIAHQPRNAASRTGRARVLAAQGELEQAQQQLRQALADAPENFNGWCLLGDGFRDFGLFDEAIAAYRHAERLAPADARPSSAIGLVEQTRGNLPASIEAYTRACELDPASALNQVNLGTSYLLGHHYGNAAECVERALAIEPTLAAAHALSGVVALRRGDFERGLPAFEKSIALDGEKIEFRGNLLFALTYTGDRARYLIAAREFGATIDRLATPFRDWLVPIDEEPKVLKVGLVSGDLRSHPVGFFIENVAAQLAQHGIELVGFPTRANFDEVTTRLKQHLAGWHPITGMTAAAAAQVVRNSAVHVLLDLSGHTHNDLALFGWRPAPVQASWLGYWASTGVSQIDYVITDEIGVSDDSPEQFTETPWRLPHTRLCFTEPGPRDAFPVSPLPALERGHLTLCCFQNLNKINDRVLKAWSAIFRSLPEARLRLQSPQSGDPLSVDALRRRLAAAGIGPDRVTIAPPAERSKYLKAYGEVDFALDTFPFPGGTTTCEALWMGVPTLTLRGATMLERQGAGMMICAGLPDWVACAEDDYVRRAITLASDRQALSLLRQSLRDQVVASPLFDAPRFARNLAEALRGMWVSGARSQSSTAAG